MSEYGDEELVDALVEKIIEEGLGLRKALLSLGFSPCMFYLRASKTPALMAKVDHAREFHTDMLADEIVTISDDASIPYQLRITMIDSRKWVANKLVPRYRDKQTIEHDFSKLSDAELIARATGVALGAGPARTDDSEPER